MPGGAAMGAAGVPAAWDRWSPRALIVVIALFLAPALLGWVPMYHVDNLNEATPRLIALARLVQQGQVPLWDRQTFAGALPYYVNDDPPIYYLPLLPLLLLANPDNLAQSYYILFIIPFCLHVAAAVAGAYFFARWELNLRPTACVVTALLYGLGAEVGTATVTITQVFVCAYLPWVMLAMSRFFFTRRATWWLLGTLLVGLMSSTGQISYLSRTYFYMFLTALLLTGLSFRRPFVPKVVSLLGVGAMMIVGIALTGIMWGGTIEGTSWFEEVFGVRSVMEQVTGFLPLSGLVMLFVPNFLGFLDSTHGWGIGLTEPMNSWYYMAGGIFTAFAAAIGLGRIVGRRGQESMQDCHERLWARVSMIALLVLMVIILGENTPLFKPLSYVMPWIKLPRPIYYRTGENWFVAILAAVGVSQLLKRQESGHGGRIVLLTVSVLTLLTASAALLVPVTFRGQTVSAWQTLTVLKEWKWFLLSPVLYIALALMAAALSVFLGRGRWLGRVVLAGILLETVWFGFSYFYESGDGPRDADATDPMARVSKKRYYRAADHPYIALVAPLKQAMKGDDVRYVASRSDVDNLAWLTGGRALLGYDSKPLAPEMCKAISPWVSGLPYFLSFQVEPRRMMPFLHNMNVGYMVIFNYQTSQSAGRIGQTDFFSIYKLPAPMPYAYTQNRVQEMGTDEQLIVLHRADLRRFVSVGPGVKSSLEGSVDLASVPWSGYTEAFETLQIANPVHNIDRTKPNRLKIDINVNTPAMLVINEYYHPGWTATVDGKPCIVRQVNYLQQGLWLASGRHQVELRFFPKSVQYGLMVSAAGGGGVLLVVAAAYWRRLRRRQQPKCLTGQPSGH